MHFHFVCKGSAFLVNMQVLCVFAHAINASARENQRIRWQIVHGGDIGNRQPAFCIPLVYLWYRINQYASDAYVLSLKEHHIRISMTEDSNPTDNGLAERVNGILKTEWIYNRPAYKNLQEAQIEIVHIIDIYNNIRPHRSINMRTPMSVYLQDESRIPKTIWKEQNWGRAAPSSLCHAWQREEG